MSKATPVQTRKSLEAVDHLVKAGIRFVPMPVFDDDDEQHVAYEVVDKLEKMHEMAEKEPGK